MYQAEVEELNLWDFFWYGSALVSALEPKTGSPFSIPKHSSGYPHRETER